MPTQAYGRLLGLTSATAFPFTIMVDGTEVSQAMLDLPSLIVEDTAVEDIGRMSCRFRDATATIAVRDEGIVTVYDDTINEQVFLGNIRRRSYAAAGPSARWITVDAVGVDSLLDRWIVPLETRPEGEGTKARFGYFWGAYTHSPMSADLTYVENVSSSLPAMTASRVSLRGAIAQICEQSGAVRFYVDASGRPHLFDGTEAGAAPFNVNEANPPGGGNIAATDIEVTIDGNIVNRLYVTGATPDVSGWYEDSTSTALYGPREAFFDAPDATTAAMVAAAASAELAKTSTPRLRGWFETVSPNDGWRAGQNIDVTAIRAGLGVLYSSAIVKVEHRFLTGTAKRRYRVWFNSTAGRWSAGGGTGKVVLTRPGSGGNTLGSGRVSVGAASIAGTIVDTTGRAVLTVKA